LRVARAVAALHNTSLDLPISLDRAAIVMELHRAEEVVAISCPDLACMVRKCVAQLLQRRAAVAFDARATVHGDLHSKNILIGPDRAFLIDLDRVGTGVPSAELGSLLAELAYRDCLAGREPDLKQLFEISAEYACHVPWPVGQFEVRWHIAAALVRERSYRCVTSLKPGRVQTIRRLLRAAEQLVASTA
jgi:Ser/Thr protein kinase RdoA (MazF antagonist)